MRHELVPSGACGSTSKATTDKAASIQIRTCIYVDIYSVYMYVCAYVCLLAYEDIHLNAFRWMNTCARHCVASLFKVNRLQILCALRFEIIQTHQASEKGA